MRAARDGRHQLPRRRSLQRRDRQRRRSRPATPRCCSVSSSAPRGGSVTRRSCATSSGGSSGPTRAPLRSSTGRSGAWDSTTSTSSTPTCPPTRMPLEQMVHDVAGLIAAGKARAWAIVNWPADQLLELSRTARREDVPQPICAQLAYSLVHRSPVEDDDMRTALEACGAPVVASYVLAGGVLSGKYDVDPAAGRAAGALDQPMYAAAATAARSLARARRATRDDSGRACRGVRAAEPRRRDGALRCDHAGADRAERRCARARGAPHRRRPRRAHCDRDVSVSGRRPGRGSAASP